MRAPETQEVCPACGHIEGQHLKHCRVAYWTDKCHKAWSDLDLETFKRMQADRLLRYFVAFHSPGDMPEEFKGGQFAERLAEAKTLLGIP